VLELVLAVESFSYRYKANEATTYQLHNALTMPLDTPQILPAHLLSSTHYPVPGKLLIAEHFFSVPLSHDPDSPFYTRHIRLFCRTAEPLETPHFPPTFSTPPKHLPLIAYINGGPGFGNSHPKDAASTPFLMEKGYKLISMDHRGMGLSNTITKATLAREGEAAAQAEYLTYFRAPYAVQDLEAVRLCLTQHWGYPEEKRRWSIMGQSYGGFVCTTYLSMYPESLREAFLFGGLPPVLERRPDETVRRCVQKLRERNQRFYEKFPADVEDCRKIVDYLRDNEVRLPDGGTLTPARWLELGIEFGMHGGLDDVHGRVMRAANDLTMFGKLTRPTIEGVSSFLGFDGAILYALLHEAIYCQGDQSNWTFDRILLQEEGFGTREQRPEYLFTGEMVFSRAFVDYSELQGLKEVADILHAKNDWSDLYDLDMLKQNDVPVYAAVYTEDLYVPLDLSLTTASIIKRCKTLITNQLYHDAIRGKADDVLKAIFALREDSID
jgi:pimeloyl-ACP methyl ester carboxylesterase